MFGERRGWARRSISRTRGSVQLVLLTSETTACGIGQRQFGICLIVQLPFPAFCDVRQSAFG